MTWDDIADSYLAVVEDRDRILAPLLASVVQDLEPKRVVDVGGGDGRFLELLLQRPGARQLSHVALIDSSSRMRQRALVRLDGRIELQIGPKCSSIPQGEWDLALLVAVWMSMESDAQAIQLLRDTAGLLTGSGYLFAAVTHPCFRDRVFHSYSTSFNMREYGKSGTPFRVTLYDSARSVTLVDTHWTLADHFRQLKAAGFIVERLIEPADFSSECEGAPWLVIVARKE